MLRAGAPWVASFDINVDASTHDLLDRSVRGMIEEAAALHCFAVIGAGPECASFSEAVTPPCRNERFPQGIPQYVAQCSDAMRRRIAAGNSHALWLTRLWDLSLKVNAVMWIENPRKSWLWRTKWWKPRVRLAKSSASMTEDAACAGDPFVVLDFCRFGRPWRKRTAFLFNGLVGGFRELCTNRRDATDHVHIILRGHSGGVHRTKIAEPYPFGVCQLLTRLCLKGAAARQRINVTAAMRRPTAPPIKAYRERG
jgi:hypothetical protein